MVDAASESGSGWTWMNDPVDGRLGRLLKGSGVSLGMLELSLSLLLPWVLLDGKDFR